MIAPFFHIFSFSPHPFCTILFWPWSLVAQEFPFKSYPYTKGKKRGKRRGKDMKNSQNKVPLNCCCNRMSSLDVNVSTLRMNHQKRQPMSHAQRARLDRAFVEQLDRQGSTWNSVEFSVQWRSVTWVAGSPGSVVCLWRTSRKTYRSSDWSYTIDKLVEGAAVQLVTNLLEKNQKKT